QTNPDEIISADFFHSEIVRITIRDEIGFEIIANLSSGHYYSSAVTLKNGEILFISDHNFLQFNPENMTISKEIPVRIRSSINYAALECLCFRSKVASKMFHFFTLQLYFFK